MKAIKYALLGLAGVIGMLVSMFGPVKVPFAEGLTKSYYRYALGALLIILLLILGAAGLFILTFDANNFKSEIVQFVKDRTQRDLVLEGNIKVTFFPKLGLDSGRASLSQRNSAREFASVNNARLYIAWLPLLRQKLVFDHVEIDGIRVNMTRLKDGSTNFDDFLISDEHLAPLTFDIDSVRVTDSSINWLDEMESQRVTLQNLHLETGRLAETVPSQLTASFHVNSEWMHLSADAHLKSRLFFDRKSGRYEFADITGKLQGDAARVSDIALNFSGSLDSYPAQRLLTAENVIVTASAKSGQYLLGGKFNISKLQVNKNNLSGNQITFDISSTYLDQIWAAAVQLPAFKVASNSFNARGVTADIDFKADGQALHGNLATPITVNFESAPKLQLDAFTLGLTARHPALTGELVANIKGSMRAEPSGQNANLGFNAIIDDSKFTGTVTLMDYSHPAYTFDISTNRLDLDRYLSDDWIKQFKNDAKSFDLTAIRDMTLHGKLRAAELRVAGIKARKLTAAIKIEQSALTIAPVTAKLYGGSLDGSIRIAAQSTPQISFKQNFKDIRIHDLFADMAGTDKLAGKGGFSIDLNAEGGNIGALRKSMKGSATLALSRGSLAGIDLRKALAEGKSELGSKGATRVRAAKFTERTEFSNLKAIFNIKDGNAIGNSFEMDSPLIRTAGDGDIMFASGNFNYRLNATVSSAINSRMAGDLAELEGLTVPIQLSGSYTAPSFALDFGSVSGRNAARLNLLTSAKAKKRAARQEKKKGH